MRMRRLLRDESGITLTELMIASFVTMIIGTMVLVWVTNVAREDRINQEDIATLDELRTAKARITKELRFANDVYPALSAPPDSVTVWVDIDRSGGTPDAGELITWELEADGSLTRTTDTGDVETHGMGLDPDLSSIVLGADDNIDIRLVSALHSDSGRVREIVTTVHVRGS